MTLTDLIAIIPPVFIIFWALLILLVDLWIPKEHKGFTALLAALGMSIDLGIVLAESSYLTNTSIIAFNNMVILDHFENILQVIFLATGLASVALAYDYLKRMKIEKGEYYPLLLLSLSGMILITQAYDLIIVFLALELLSVPLYVLSGFALPRVESEEASLKYFFLGAFSSGFVLYGIALVFGATAATSIPAILASLTSATFNPILFMIGAALLLVGLGFKVAIVPFNMWVPDVYQGAPTSVTGFMAVGVKIAGFAALARVFLIAFPSISSTLTPILWALAALTMIGGNVVALAQTNLKRLMAYSGIASAGYLLMAFVPYGQTGLSNDIISALLFYLVAYAVTSFGAWAVIISLEQVDGNGLDLEDYAGLGGTHRWLSVVLSLCLLSYAGVPLTVGFWGKFYLFRAAILGGYWPLAVIGLLASVVSAFYYLRVIVKMYMQPGQPKVRRDMWLTLATFVSAIAVVGLGILPGLLSNILP
ncbi:MAG TPA: NADH-quinone oxidoreductase subunit N [Longilinea sp.]|nr:NADH-quinone oxidoreductase subunit N [Longilinea sp.]